MKIVVLDGYSVNPGDLSWDGLREFGEVEVFDRTSPDEVVIRAEKAEIILTNKVSLDKHILNQLPILRYIGVLATGYNVVNLDETHRRGIIVTNIPAYSTDSVAQMTFAHILNITNRVCHYAQENARGRWSNNADFCYWDTPLSELAGKSFGVVGLGHIGKRVARIAVDFGMNVYALTSKDTALLPHGIRKMSLEELLAASDIITLHCPLNESTHHLIRKETISMMKRGAIIINTGRGPLVNEHDVAEALRNGKLAAYGADVLEKEPPSSDNELLSAPNAYITPHIAWATMEARKRLIDIAIKNVNAFISNHPQNVL